MATGIFAIDNVAKSQPLTTIANSALSQFSYQAPVSPDTLNKRMTFTKLVDVNGGKLPDVEFYINPNNIGYKRNVMQQRKLTKGGWVIQFWGHDLASINVQCITGNFQPLYGVEVQAPLSKQAFTSWANQALERFAKGGGPLKVFEQIKEYAYHQRFSESQPYVGNPMIQMWFEDSLYDGFFTDFQYNLESGSPFNISFNFDFTILKRRDMSFADIGGSLNIAQLIGNPLKTLQNTVKTTTNLIESAAAKETAKLASQIPYVGGFLANNLMDTLPTKMTLW